jgi:hypothetical protein
MLLLQLLLQLLLLFSGAIPAAAYATSHAATHARGAARARAFFPDHPLFHTLIGSSLHTERALRILVTSQLRSLRPLSTDHLTFAQLLPLQ